MAYTPELSDESSSTLRRIAWAMNIPMTRAIEIIMDTITMMIEREKVCEECRDKTKCAKCGFSKENHRTPQFITRSYKKRKGQPCA